MKVAWKKIQSCYKQHQTVSQSPPIKRRALPLHLMVSVSLSPAEETLGGTVVPPENLNRNGTKGKKKKKKKQPTEGGSQRGGGGAAAEHKDSCILYLPPLTNHILFCNTLNQITQLMNKTCFHSKGNIPISQIQYLRQYLPILGVNR